MAVSTLKEIRILPPIAIGRFGNAPEPMDNYDVTPDPDAPPQPGAAGAGAVTRTINPATTLRVDRATGKITGADMPAAVRFRDDQKRIKPVAPFVEVWARFTDEGQLEPLTLQHIKDLNLKIEWRVHVANLKPFRRTGDPNDQVHANLDWFTDYTAKDIFGNSANFKPGKRISFGSVQFIDPESPGFPEIRLRFTPAEGKVFGPRPPAEDPNVADDVYDATRGRWVGHVDDDATSPPSTVPGSIFYGHLEGQGNARMWVSNGYLDDACDGTVEVRVTFGAVQLMAHAWVSAGPPMFAPDTFAPRTVGDELEQILHGPLVDAASVDRGSAVDLIRRAEQTVQIMNTSAMNDDFPDRPVSNMARHDAGWGRAREHIFPTGVAKHSAVQDVHHGVLDRAQGGDFSGIADMMRPHDQVADLTNNGRRRMPGMMRGADGFHLALTRRQVAMVRAAEAAPPPAPAPPPVVGPVPPPTPTPEQNMLAVIAHFLPRRNRHVGIEVDAQRTLADLFDTPPALLNYLRTAIAKGPRSGSLAGTPLIVPGAPERSALPNLIRNPAHPMHGPLTTDLIGDAGKTGLQILEEWIRSL